MTWTVFERNAGQNETTEDAPGRGGYKYVLVPLPSEEAIEWWEDEYDENPRRKCYMNKYGDRIWDGEQAWHYREREDPDEVRSHCGEIEMEAGGIGVPMTRRYTWSELKGRLDVKVVTADEV
jgi:hypothetical protein